MEESSTGVVPTNTAFPENGSYLQATQIVLTF